MASNAGEDVLPLAAAVLLREAEEGRAEADWELREVLGMLGIERHDDATSG